MNTQTIPPKSNVASVSTCSVSPATEYLLTPEQAREIDRQEFEADCRAARERAHALVAQRHVERDERVTAWLSTPPPAGHLPCHYRHAPKAALSEPTPAQTERRQRTNSLRLANEQQITLTCRGNTMTLSEWARTLGISPRTLHSRIKYGWPVERALFKPVARARPRNREPGVASDFPAVSATDAPRHAQDFSELEFSE